MNENENERYKRAKRKVMALKSLYIHLFFYIVINIGLFAINMLTSSAYLWFYWSLFGWGIGIVAHALFVYGFINLFDKKWVDKKIREIIEREKC